MTNSLNSLMLFFNACWNEICQLVQMLQQNYYVEKAACCRPGTVVTFNEVNMVPDRAAGLSVSQTAADLF